MVFINLMKYMPNNHRFSIIHVGVGFEINSDGLGLENLPPRLLDYTPVQGSQIIHVTRKDLADASMIS